MFNRSIRGELVECPGAKPAVLPGYEAHEFFAYRQDDPAIPLDKEYKNERPKMWCIYHINGKSLTWGPTKQRAIDASVELLNASGVLS